MENYSIFMQMTNDEVHTWLKLSHYMPFEMDFISFKNTRTVLLLKCNF